MGPNEKCGVFGVYGKGIEVSRLTYFGLFALQHRGQESSGIATSDGGRLSCFRNTGLVDQVFNEEAIKNLEGHIAIGHNRYSTSLGTGLLHAQPTIVDFDMTIIGGAKTTRIEGGLVALAHNGNLPSVTALIEFLDKKGVPTEGRSDSELMAQAIAYYLSRGKSLDEAIRNAYPLFTGAFSLVVMTKDALVAVRDECGIRPLVIGRVNGGFAIASETCAFKTIGAEFLREVMPGEMVVFNEKGMKSVELSSSDQKLDIFEFVYLARPDSTLLGKSVYQVRENFGKCLAQEFPVRADVVVPVPETAVPFAIGYAREADIPLEMALVKNRYIHRTFIDPDQRARDMGVDMKLTTLPEVLKGARVALIDDSIVRGTTSQKIVELLFKAGAREVHFLVGSPPVRFPDFYGIDTPRQEELIASEKQVEEVRRHLGATSLHYLSLDGMIEATGLSKEVFCLSCFTGEYPIDLGERADEVRKPSHAFAQHIQERMFRARK